MTEHSTEAWEYNVEATAEEDEAMEGGEDNRVQIQFCLREHVEESLRQEDEDDGGGGGGGEDDNSKKLPPHPLLHSSSFFSDILRSLSRDENDDESSVMSVAYYDPADFSSSHWRMAMDAPTIGFAVAGLAMAITHPLFFLAGMLTAWGTAHAASKGYDCWMDQTWMQQFFPPSPEPEALETPVTSNVTDKDDESTKAPSTSSEEDASTERIAGEEVPPEQPVLLLTEQQPDITGSTTTMRSAYDDSLPENWIDSHYPALKKTVTTNEEFRGLNVLEFVNVFFSDDAPFHFKEFQKKRGDLNIHYGDWEDAPNSGKLSLYPPAAAPEFPASTSYHSFRTRLLTFKAKTNSSSLLGPPYATTKKTQRLFILSKRSAVLEMKTVLRDIPFCDRFFVLERWVLNAQKDARGRYTTRLNVQTGVIFTESCPFEGMIRPKSTAAVCDVVKAWCRMAQQAMSWTEQAKRDRLLMVADDGTTTRHEDEDVLLEETTDEPADTRSIEYPLHHYAGSTTPMKNTTRPAVEESPRKASWRLPQVWRRKSSGIIE